MTGTGIIDQILVDDQSQPRKQRHTAKRSFDRLKAEHAVGGGFRLRQVVVGSLHAGGFRTGEGLRHTEDRARAARHIERDQ